MNGDPWWMTAMRVLFVIGMASGAWTGIKAARAAKAQKAKAAEQGAVEPAQAADPGSASGEPPSAGATSREQDKEIR